MHRFFVTKESINELELHITGDDVQHISKVLRLRVDEKILVNDSTGLEYLCSITEINKKDVVCTIIETLENKTEAPIRITLFQGLPKSQKMDLIVQKCVELGVVDFWPVVTERVIVKTEDRDISGKIERWNRISEEAAKQSSRGLIPLVHNPITINKAIEMIKAMDLGIIPYENEKNTTLKTILKHDSNIKTVGILIGPEGGFEDTEVKLCLDNNILPVTLGPRILRTETAGFITAAIVQYELGDVGESI